MFTGNRKRTTEYSCPALTEVIESASATCIWEGNLQTPSHVNEHHSLTIDSRVQVTRLFGMWADSWMSTTRHMLKSPKAWLATENK